MLLEARATVRAPPEDTYGGATTPAFSRSLVDQGGGGLSRPLRPHFTTETNIQGGSSSSSSGRAEMEALLRAIRAAKEAAEIRGGSVASYLGARAGAMEATFVSAFLRKCLISWRK